MLRRTVAFVLGILGVSLAFTQMGFVGVLLADGVTVYFIFLLMPVALAAVLLGTLSGAGMGLFCGLTLYLHALVLPLDYFEFAYVTLGSSILGMAACGLVLGLSLSLVFRIKNQKSSVRSLWRLRVLRPHASLACDLRLASVPSRLPSIS